MILFMNSRYFPRYRYGISLDRIRIGTACNYYYPALSETVRRFSSVDPDVTMEITGRYSTDLITQLNRHQPDLCISSRRQINGNWIPLIKDDMMAAFAMAASDPGITMNNHLNCILWNQQNIVFLPVRPKQKTEIGIAVSDEADINVLHFARLLMHHMKTMKQSDQNIST